MTVNHDVAGSSPAGGAIQELSETFAYWQRFRISCLYLKEVYEPITACTLFFTNTYKNRQTPLKSNRDCAII